MTIINKLFNLIIQFNLFEIMITFTKKSVCCNTNNNCTKGIKEQIPINVDLLIFETSLSSVDRVLWYLYYRGRHWNKTHL